MIEVRSDNQHFIVYDTDTDEPVVKFRTRREADNLVAALALDDVHEELRRWTPDLAPTVY